MMVHCADSTLVEVRIEHLQLHKQCITALHHAANTSNDTVAEVLHHVQCHMCCYVC
jgi:hypothetical protein